MPITANNHRCSLNFLRILGLDDIHDIESAQSSEAVFPDGALAFFLDLGRHCIGELLELTRFFKCFRRKSAMMTYVAICAAPGSSGVPRPGRIHAGCDTQNLLRKPRFVS